MSLPPDSSRPLVVRSPSEPEKREEPPVVARMVIEIRSDGSRTIARGALEDASLGQRVTLQAEGSSPFALAVSLAGSLLQGPKLVRAAARALLAAPRRK